MCQKIAATHDITTMRTTHAVFFIVTKNVKLPAHIDGSDDRGKGESVLVKIASFN